MKNLKKIAFAALFACSNAFAGSLVCSGTVESVGYHDRDKLMVKLSSMNTSVFFCNPNAEWQAPGTGRVMNPETCKSLFATFLSARATKEPISVVHFDGDNVPSTCSGFENFKDVFIRFVNY